MTAQLMWLTTTRDYVYARVTPPPGVVIPDDVADPRIAIIPEGQHTLVDADFKAAEWAPGEVNTARLLAGRGTTAPLATPGVFKIYLRLTNNAAEPDIYVGSLRVRLP